MIHPKLFAFYHPATSRHSHSSNTPMSFPAKKKQYPMSPCLKAEQQTCTIFDCSQLSLLAFSKKPLDIDPEPLMHFAIEPETNCLAEDSSDPIILPGFYGFCALKQCARQRQSYQVWPLVHLQGAGSNGVPPSERNFRKSPLLLARVRHCGRPNPRLFDPVTS